MNNNGEQQAGCERCVFVCVSVSVCVCECESASALAAGVTHSLDLSAVGTCHSSDPRASLWEWVQVLLAWVLEHWRTGCLGRVCSQGVDASVAGGLGACILDIGCLGRARLQGMDASAAGGGLQIPTGLGSEYRRFLHVASTEVDSRLANPTWRLLGRWIAASQIPPALAVSTVCFCMRLLGRCIAAGLPKMLQDLSL